MLYLKTQQPWIHCQDRLLRELEVASQECEAKPGLLRDEE